MLKILSTVQVVFFMVTFLSVPAFAETVELVTYYPAQINLGEANLNNASIGMLDDDPADGELFVETRVRIGDPGNVTDSTDPSLSVYTNTTNTNNGLINLYVTEPIPGSGADAELRFMTVSKRNAADNARLDWTFAMGEGDSPSLLFFRADRPDVGNPIFESPMTIAWNGFVGINNENPEAMLHIGTAGGPEGDILLENPRAIKWRDKDGNIQNVLSYTTANNTMVQQNAPTGGIQLTVRNNSPSGNIQFRTGPGTVNTSQGIDESLRMFISRSGKVGIGGPYNTNNEPEHELNIEPFQRNNAGIKVKGGGKNGNSGYAALILQAGNVSNADQAWVWQRYSDPMLRFWVKGENRVLIDGQGTRNGGSGGTSNAIAHMKIGRGVSTDIVKNSPMPAASLYNSGTLDVGDIYLRSQNTWLSQVVGSNNVSSIAGIANHNQTINVPSGTTDDWNIFVSAHTAGLIEPNSENDNAITMMECFATAKADKSGWVVTMKYRFNFWPGTGGNSVEFTDGKANYLVVRK